MRHRTRAEIATMLAPDALVNWIKTQPQDTPYIYTDGVGRYGGCAIRQYLNAHNLDVIYVSTDTVDVRIGADNVTFPLPPATNSIVVNNGMLASYFWQVVANWQTLLRMKGVAA